MGNNFRMDHFERGQRKRQERHGVVVVNAMRSIASCFGEEERRGELDGPAAGIGYKLLSRTTSRSSLHSAVMVSGGRNRIATLKYLVLKSYHQGKLVSVLYNHRK